uniref:Uncharacterized protein n=1 Tax=Hyaloperonospora arabidopsidis (strain Emoy2) TaxID=559515 RepID=M4B6W4_HYAAE
MRVTSASTSRVSDGDGCTTGSVQDPSLSSVADRLRTSMADTARLLADFEQDFEDGGAFDWNIYEKCCRQLVTFMVTHMETSRDFVQQMEQVIQASYANTSGWTFRSTGTEELWLRYKVEADAQVPVGSSSPFHRRSMTETPVAGNNAVAVTPLLGANATAARLRTTCSPHVGLSVSTPSLVERGGRRHPKTRRLIPRRGLKRPHYIVSRNLYSAGKLDCDEKDGLGDRELVESTKEDETEPEQEIEMLSELPENLRSGQQMGDIFVQSGRSGDDGIAWPCAGATPLERSSAFVKRLKTAVELVDAGNCCPPPGMKCTQKCASIRAGMCQVHRRRRGGAGVCHDKTCCIWRDIDSHFVRCRNTDCEFKNRVGLRQAMHDILQNELKLKVTSDKLIAAKTITSCSADAQHDQSGTTSPSQIEGNIQKLEEECAKLEDTISLHKERERAFEFDLNALDIPPANCESDYMPDFHRHYVMKRPREHMQKLG